MGTAAPPTPKSESKSTSDARRRWLLRAVLVGAVIAGLMYLPYRVQGGEALSQLLRMEKQLDATRAKAAQLRRDNRLRRRAIEALRTDPTAIEEAAREQLGMVYPGELIVIAGESR